ncbi:MAG: leucine-rich repeat domain-containing protein, partial [Clostridia bacterium]|nr:leucine-rich repeat domain-containing protein [Clostridia bacterium]
AIGTDTFETGGFGDHDFTKKQVAPNFLETSATCLQKATYVYSCACGLKGTDTFEAGAIGDHNFVDNQPCTVCHASYGLKYEMAQDNSGYEVSIGDCTDRHIVIPMYYNSLLVTKIANNGFQRCTSLLSVTFSDGIKTIGNHAFASCRGLTSVTIPASVRKIGDFAFNACYRLVEVINKSHYFTIAKGGTDNGRIGEYALSVFNARDIVNSQLSYDNDFVVFTDGEQKILVGYNGTATNWVIPSYVTAINRYVFHSCKDVKSIIIPKSVTSIGEYAFKGCSSLSEVYYTGTMGGWSGIDIADENGSLTGAKTYYYSQNEPTDDGNYWHYDTDETTPVVW